jgi:hypothetical protein
VNDQGTASVEDDALVGGATFEFRQDDGDGVYEPSTDDAPPLATIDAPDGFAVFTPPGPGAYWVTEVSAPTGLGTAPPQLVTYTGDPQNCTVILERAECVADDDGSGGFLVVRVADSPSGGVGPDTGQPTLPPSDVGASDPHDVPPYGWIAVLAGLIAFLAVLLRSTDRRRD